MRANMFEKESEWDNIGEREKSSLVHSGSAPTSWYMVKGVRIMNTFAFIRCLDYINLCVLWSWNVKRFHHYLQQIEQSCRGRTEGTISKWTILVDNLSAETWLRGLIMKGIQVMTLHIFTCMFTVVYIWEKAVFVWKIFSCCVLKLGCQRRGSLNAGENLNVTVQFYSINSDSHR